MASTQEHEDRQGGKAVHGRILRRTHEPRVSHPVAHRYGPAPFEPDWTSVPDIFDEVEEDLRAERARGFARRFAGTGVALLVLVLVVTGAVVWWQQRQKDAAASLAARFIAAQKTADVSAGSLGHRDHAAEQEAAGALAGIAADSPAGYRTLARLRLAALQWQMGDHPHALGTLSAISADSGAPQLLRDLATLTSGEHQVDSGDPAQVKQLLSTLTAPDNHWRPLAEQAIALADLRLGKPAEAAAILQRLSTDMQTPQGIREMAADLLLTIDVPPTAAAAPKPASPPHG